MFSSKSTELLRRLKRYEIAGHNILRVKYAEDCRYSVDSISTHDRQRTFFLTVNDNRHESKAIGARKLSDNGEEWRFPELNLTTAHFGSEQWMDWKQDRRTLLSYTLVN